MLSFLKAFVIFVLCIVHSHCAVPMINQRPSDSNLMINKLQGALEEFARGDDIEMAELALEAVIDSIKDEVDDVDALENIIHNVLPPAVAEPDAEVLQDEVVEKAQIETPPQEEIEEVAENNESDSSDDVSSDVIRYNSKGESIENPHAVKGNAKGCKDSNKKPLEIEPQQPVQIEDSSDSDGSDEIVERFDSDGNSIEKPDKKITSHDVRRKKKEAINNVLNEQVVQDQLEMRQMESDESGFKDDDIPVITIPMVQILKQYQRMQQQAAGIWSEETEEYSDEMTTLHPAQNPRIQNILRRISNERKREKLEQLDPKVRSKSAALRVLDQMREEAGIFDDEESEEDL